MPALHNAKHERFANLLKQGVPVFKAYSLAGFKPHRGNCYRLRDSESVKRRYLDLTRGIAMKTRVTVETITQELDDAAALARRVEQPGAVIQAVQTKAKLHGLLIDRKESGAPGDFDGLKTEGEVIAAFRAEHGDEAASLLAVLLAKAGAQAAPVEPEPSQVDVAGAGDTIN